VNPHALGVPLRLVAAVTDQVVVLVPPVRCNDDSGARPPVK